ncbi:MAG: MvaI/BcnI family restriction endonuclease [Lachnospiraceae bacterium]|nr:MvaI/BcnI family restriction endonuclease [Lachnospiraceae bacterium]
MDNREQELIAYFTEIKRKGWIQTQRHGDQCLGNAFEDFIGKAEDNKPVADYYDIELKAHRIVTQSMVTLFSKAPSYPKRVNTHLRETYGVVEDGYGKKVLHTTISGLRENSHRGGYNFKADVQRAKQRIYLQIKDTATQKLIDDEVYWSFSVLNKALEKKLSKMAILYGEEKDEDGKHFVRYTEMRIIEQLTLEDLIKSIEDGKLFIDIRIGVYASGKNAGKTHDHGTAFRMHLKDLLEVYGTVKIIK